MATPRPDSRTSRVRTRRAVGCGVVAAVTALVLVAALVGGVVWLRMNEYISPTPFEPRCRLVGAGETAVLDLGQAHHAAIIVGRAIDRGLPARAGSIAMATAYQESGIRNLDYGDRDSLGLFQQRPSQGWGSPAQVTDPYYATDRFYDALVKVEGWQTGDINTIAQDVQRSGYPEAYRKHESNARVVASVLSGHSPAGLTCGYLTPGVADPAALAESLARTLGADAQVSADGTLTVTAPDEQRAWAIAHHAVANARDTGVASVALGGRRWTFEPRTMPEWEQVHSAAPLTVTVTFLAP